MFYLLVHPLVHDWRLQMHCHPLHRTIVVVANVVVEVDFAVVTVDSAVVEVVVVVDSVVA